jgi:hypothetical protein
MPDNKKSREDAAADAIIARSLGHFDAEHLSDEEIMESSEAGPLSDEARAIIKKFKPKTRRVSSECEPKAAELELAGMYRAGSDDSLDDAVKEEIKRKRDELRERIKRKLQGDV